MTPVTEHPLRCETCENDKCIWNVKNPLAFAGIFPHRRRTLASYWAERFIERVGCASHSASSDVLDNLEFEIEQGCGLSELTRKNMMVVSLDFIHEKFDKFREELRQQTKEREP